VGGWGCDVDFADTKKPPTELCLSSLGKMYEKWLKIDQMVKKWLKNG
jgi:hypothetical protein